MSPVNWRSIVVRTARWSATHPWRAIIGWVVFVALCLAVGSAIGTRDATSVDYRVGEAGRAEAIAAQGGFTVLAVEKILITARDGGAWDLDAGAAAAQEVAGRVAALPEVAAVGNPIRSADGTAMLVTATLRGDQVQAKNHLAALLAATDAAQRGHPGVRVAQTGDTSIGAGVDEQRNNDLLLSERLTLPITLLILLIVFGSLLAASVPVLLALSAIAASIGISALFSHLVPDAGLGAHRRVRLGVVVSTACLYVADDVIFSSLATATIIVVLVAMVSSLTVLPALLVTLGPRMDHPRIPLLRRRIDRAGTGRLWPALLRPAMRNPVATLLMGLVLTLGLAAPAVSMSLNQPGTNTFSDAIPAVATHHQLIAKFPAQPAAHLVVVSDVAAHSGQVRFTLAELTARAQADPAFGADVRGSIQSSGDGQVNVLTLAIPHEETSDQAIRCSSS